MRGASEKPLSLSGKEWIGRTEVEGWETCQKIVAIILSGLNFLNCKMRMTAALHHKVAMMIEKIKAWKVLT